MAETRLSNDDSYEQTAINFQLATIAILNAALREAGIDGETKRRAILVHFAHDMGVLLDQYWLEGENGQRLHPYLCFVPAGPASDCDVDALGHVQAPSKFFSFCEYSGGSVRYLFDLGEDLPPGMMGVFKMPDN